MPGTEVVAGEDTWVFVSWDKASDVINNANVLFTGTWKIKTVTALIRIKKVVEGGGDIDDIFLIHLKEGGRILGSTALQRDEISGWMTLDMGSDSSRTIEIFEVVPMEYNPVYTLSIQVEGSDPVAIPGKTLAVYPGDSITIIVTNRFTHTGFFKDKNWVRNMFSMP